MTLYLFSGHHPKIGNFRNFFSPLTLLLSLTLSYLQAQDYSELPNELSKDLVESIYGLDPTIYNGQLYVNPNAGVRGTPYLGDFDFRDGSAIIRGEKFDGLKVRFDTYSQKLILRYKNKFGAYQNLAVSDAWIDGFSIENMNFKRFTLPDGTKKIIQVIGDGSIRIGIFWRKELLFNAGTIKPGYYYSLDEKSLLLITSEGLIPFRNKRIFLRYFGKKNQPLISAYLKKNKVDFRKATDKDWNNLITFCNTLQ